jgi:thioredoxin 1
MIVTDQNFEEVINSNSMILVDFWAAWCGPCRQVAPILDDIEKNNGLLVGKLNIDESPSKAIEYSIHSIPSMVLFIDGKPVHNIVGAKPKHVILKELSPWM